jgi:uncharacterized protein YecA (UPF0149 family)
MGEESMDNLTELLTKIKGVLPFYVYPTKRLCTQLNENNQLNVSPKSKFKITQVEDGGYEGGILCVVAFEKLILVVSLTHVEVAGDFVLKNEIIKYQKNRISELEVLHSNEINVNSGYNVSRNELCPCGSGKKYKKCCG